MKPAEARVYSFAALVVGVVLIATLIVGLVVRDEWSLFRAKQEAAPILDALDKLQPVATKPTGDAATARKFAERALARHGVTKLADDATVTYAAGQWLVTGPALMKSGHMRPVSVVYNVGTFDNTIRWKLASLVIDGELVSEEEQR